MECIPLLLFVAVTLTIPPTVVSRQHSFNSLAYLQRLRAPLDKQSEEWKSGDLSSIFSWNYTLPEAQLRRGVVYSGSNYRLRRVIKELLEGKSSGERPFKVQVIGGSISW